MQHFGRAPLSRIEEFIQNTYEITTPGIKDSLHGKGAGEGFGYCVKSVVARSGAHCILSRACIFVLKMVDTMKASDAAK